MDLPARRLRPRFAEVYAQHHDFVWRSLRLLGVPEGSLDDATQDVFVVVYRRLGQFEGRASLRTWLYEIARRIGSRYRAKAQRHAARHVELAPEVRSADDVEATMDRRRAVALLAEFTASLDDDRQRVFVLAEVGQLRGREIAEALDVNLNTVYARLRSAQKDLDRLVHRMRVREARVLVEASRRERPSRASQRRTWAVLVGKLGIPVAASTGWVGTVAGVGMGAAALALSVAIVIERPKAPPRSSDPVAAQTRPPTAAASVAPPSPIPAPDDATVRARLPPPAPVAADAADPPARRRPPAPTPEADLAAEVAAVQRLRRAPAAEFDTLYRAYVRTFGAGTLRQEVDALKVERTCPGATDAAAQVEAFARRWPSSTLVAQLRAVCGVDEKSSKVAPQKPDEPGTPGS